MSRPQADHIAVAAGLREMPGVWLPVGTYRARYSAQNTAHRVRTGWGPYTPVGDETCLYVRYAPTTTPATEMEAADAR